MKPILQITFGEPNADGYYPLAISYKGETRQVWLYQRTSPPYELTDGSRIVTQPYWHWCTTPGEQPPDDRIERDLYMGRHMLTAVNHPYFMHQINMVRQRIFPEIDGFRPDAPSVAAAASNPAPVPGQCGFCGRVRGTPATPCSDLITDEALIRRVSPGGGGDDICRDTIREKRSDLFTNRA